MSGFDVVPEELRAGAGRVEPLAASVTEAITQTAGPVQAAFSFHPEFGTAEVLEAFGARSIEVGQSLARSYSGHAAQLNTQAGGYEETDGGSSRMFEV
jgi:hypothetical protein